MAWQGIEAPRKTIEFPAAPFFFSSKKWIKLIPKTIGNRKKRLCVRLRSGDKHHLRKSAGWKAQIRKAFVPLTGLICAFRSADFLRWCLSPERNLTHNLFFLFPIVFGINSISFQCTAVMWLCFQVVKRHKIHLKNIPVCPQSAHWLFPSTDRMRVCASATRSSLGTRSAVISV